MIPNWLRRHAAPGVFLLVFVALVLWVTAETYGAETGWPEVDTCTAPGDAACAGWTENEKSIRSVKDGWETFIYSDVYEPQEGHGYGYFRMISSGRLEFSVITGATAGEDGVSPIKVVMKGNGPLVVIYQRWYVGRHAIGILNGRSYSEFDLGGHKPVFEDLDGDGMYETMVDLYIPVVSPGMNITEVISHLDVDGPILGIYRHTPSFVRVKGKGFEKYFVTHARELIEKKYPEWMERGKFEGMTEKVRRQLDYIVENWLATIESTQDAGIITEALKKLEELPYPCPLAKKGTIERLVRQGYPMLKQR